SALEEVPRLIPANAEDPHRSRYVDFSQDVDREAFEQRCKPRPVFCPRKPNLANAVLGTMHARRPRMEMRLELAAVAVTPRALLRMVIGAELATASRTRPPNTLRMLHPNVHPLLVRAWADARDGPRCGQTEQVSVQFGVLHGGRSHISSRTHAKPGSPENLNR